MSQGVQFDKSPLVRYIEKNIPDSVNHDYYKITVLMCAMISLKRMVDCKEEKFTSDLVSDMFFALSQVVPILGGRGSETFFIDGIPLCDLDIRLGDVVFKASDYVYRNREGKIPSASAKDVLEIINTEIKKFDDPLDVKIIEAQKEFYKEKFPDLETEEPKTEYTSECEKVLI